MFERMRQRSIRESQITNLRNYIESVYESELKGAKTLLERGAATTRANHVCESERKQLLALQQEQKLKKKGNVSALFFENSRRSRVARWIGLEQSRKRQTSSSD